jgi:hypothetical protein
LSAHPTIGSGRPRYPFKLRDKTTILGIPLSLKHAAGIGVQEESVAVLFSGESVLLSGEGKRDMGEGNRDITNIDLS